MPSGVSQCLSHPLLYKNNSVFCQSLAVQICQKMDVQHHGQQPRCFLFRGIWSTEYDACTFKALKMLNLFCFYVQRITVFDQ